MVKRGKRCELATILMLLSSGKTRQEIIKQTDIKKSALSNHIKRLEDLDNIKRGKGHVIDIISSSLNHPRVTKNKVHKDFNKRGHAHNIKVHFNKHIKLKEKSKVIADERAGLLERLSFGSLKCVRSGFTIWINKDNLTLYSNNSYYSKNALHSKFKALRDVDKLIQELIDKYDFPSSYGIEIFREHYGLIFNKFAIWLNKLGRKMYIENKKGKTILWVDKSRKDDIGLNEFEGENPQKVNSADSFFDSQDKTSWKVDAEFILNGFNKTNENLNLVSDIQKREAEKMEEYAEELRSHKDAIKMNANQMGEFVNLVRDLKEILKAINK